MQARPLRPADFAAPDDGQELLDGLPIPAALIGRSEVGSTEIVRANEAYRTLVRHDERLRGALAADVPLLGAGAIAAALRDHFAGDAPAFGPEPIDVETPDGRWLVASLARLSGSANHPRRCLLTLLDRSGDRAPERSYRPAPARDPLTGLPNRRAFEERVGEILGHPNFAPGSHALLTVMLAAGQPQEEADEMLIAVAGRLLAALRAGDLLARSGERSFAVLMRLEKGWPDALELAERLRAVLATPFRLSSREASLACSVQCSPLV